MPLGITEIPAAIDTRTPHCNKPRALCVVTGTRKRGKKKEREVKKKRTKTKNARKVRLPENDTGHNKENHMNQSESEAESETEADTEGRADDEVSERGGTAGSAGRATSTTATLRQKRPPPAQNGGGQPADAPAKKKRPSCCSLCKKAGHQKPKCPDLEHADAEAPVPTLHVGAGDVIKCWDIESDSSSKEVYESGSCLAKFSHHRWRNVTGESKVVLHNTAVSAWCTENCNGLAAECAASTKTVRQLMDEDTAFMKEHDVKIIKAHNGLSSDTRILCEHGAREGIDVLQEWKDAGVRGLLDPAIIIPRYKVTELQHPPNDRHKNHWSYLSNGALYKMATGKTMEEDVELSHHRALDDSKAERTWMQELQPMTDLLFGEGAEQRPTVISIDDLQRWFAQKQKHHAYKARNGL